MKSSKKEPKKHSVLYLPVHLAFMCNMRLGEVVGADTEGIDLANKYFQINQTFQRIETEALE